MATDTYSIHIETSQAVSALGTLKSALGGLAAGFAIGGITELVKGFAQLSDSLTTVNSKLKQIDASNVQGQFKGLMEIANRTRTEFETVANTYTKIAKAGEAMGLSNSKAAQFTENLISGMKLSGKEGREVESALYNINKAMNSGVVQGEEWNNMLDTLPIEAIRAIEKYKGMDRLGLKNAVSKGQLLPQDIITPLTSPEFTKSMKDQMAGLDPTIGGALTTLGNNLKNLFNEFNTTSGAGRIFADVIRALADGVALLTPHIDKVAIGVAALAAFTPVGRAIMIAVAAFEAFKKVLEVLAPYWEKLKTWITDFITAISNSAPIQAFGQAVTAIIEPIRQLVELLIKGATAFAQWTGLDKVLGFKGAQGQTTMGPTGTAATALEGAVGTPGGESVGGTIGIGGTGAPSTTGGSTTNPYFNDVARQNADYINQQMEVYKQKHAEILANYQETNAEKLKEMEYANTLIGLKDTEREKVQALHDATAEFYKAVTPLQEEYDRLRQSSTDQDQQKAAALKEEIDKITQAHEQYSQKITEILDKKQQALDAAKAQEQAEHAIAAAAEKRKAIEGDIANLKQQAADKVSSAQQQLDLKGLSGVQREMKRIQYEEDNWAEAAKRRVKEQWGEGDQEGLQKRLSEIDAIKNKTTQDLQGIAQQSSALEQQHTSAHQKLGQGWSNTMDGMRQKSQETTTAMSGMFDKMSGGITDSIMNFVKTGKFDAKSLISAFEPLMKGGLNQLFSSLLGGGGKGGGIFDGLFGSAGGGIGGLGDSITGLTNQLGSMQGAMGPNGSSGAPAFVNIAGGLDPLTQGFDQLGNIFSQGLDSLGSSLGGIFDQLGSSLGGLFGGGGGGGGLGGLFGGGGGGGGGGGFGDIFSGIGDIFGGGGSGGGIGGIFDDIGNAFSGFFAQGGTIPGGKFGVVGERGPEFVSGPAQVTPMDQMGGGMQVVNYNINATDAMSFKQMLAADPSFIHAVAMKGASGMPRRR